MGTTAVLVLVGAAVAVVYAIASAFEAYYLWSPPQIVRCPESGQRVHVRLDATLAALTAVPGPPKLLVKQCERWPERKGCDQECIRRP
jgi:hypothetical protein